MRIYQQVMTANTKGIFMAAKYAIRQVWDVNITFGTWFVYCDECIVGQFYTRDNAEQWVKENGR